MAERGEVLAFAGAVTGAVAGFLVGEKLRHGAAGAAFGLIGGVFAAHWLNKSVLPPSDIAGLPRAPDIAGLADVPPGYFEIPGGAATPGQPVFTRGRLVPLAEYADYDRKAILNELEPAQSYLRRYPRWTLYGGPTSAQYLGYVTDFLKKWAFDNDLIYLPDPDAGVVKPMDIAGGWPHSDFRFHQVWEPGKPRTVALYTKSGKWGWHYNA
jgi:hypothetical protein